MDATRRALQFVKHFLVNFADFGCLQERAFFVVILSDLNFKDLKHAINGFYTDIPF